MKKKVMAVLLGIAVIFAVSPFVSADTQEVAMNKAEFVSA